MFSQPHLLSLRWIGPGLSPDAAEEDSVGFFVPFCCSSGLFRDGVASFVYEQVLFPFGSWEELKRLFVGRRERWFPSSSLPLAFLERKSFPEPA